MKDGTIDQIEISFKISEKIQNNIINERYEDVFVLIKLIGSLSNLESFECNVILQPCYQLWLIYFFYKMKKYNLCIGTKNLYFTYNNMKTENIVYDSIILWCISNSYYRIGEYDKALEYLKILEIQNFNNCLRKGK